MKINTVFSGKLKSLECFQNTTVRLMDQLVHWLIHSVRLQWLLFYALYNPVCPVYENSSNKICHSLKVSFIVQKIRYRIFMNIVFYLSLPMPFSPILPCLGGILPPASGEDL